LSSNTTRPLAAAPPVEVADVPEVLVGKSAWRALCRKRMRARSPILRTAHAVRAAGELLSLAAALRPRFVGLYAPLGGEVDTRELANVLIVNGHALAYPWLTGDGETMAFRACEGPSALRPRPRSRLMEPTGEIVAPEDIGLLVAPALGIAPTLQRLGRGGGYYDRYLPRLPDTAYNVALVPAECVIDWGPIERHDARFDAVCTEHGLFGPAAGPPA